MIRAIEGIRIFAVRDREPVEVVSFIAHVAVCAGEHDWQWQGGTTRHDYRECARCKGRQILDLDPLGDVEVAVDVAWTHQAHEQHPDLERANRLSLVCLLRGEAAVPR